jgi:hypothetical protein
MIFWDWLIGLRRIGVEREYSNIYYDLRLQIRSGERNVEMRKTVVVAATVLAVMVMMVSVLALLQSSRTIPSHGTIRGVNVGIFQDSGCTQQLTSVDWGTLDNGTSSVKTVYVKNEGTVNMTLSLSNNTWVPSGAVDYMALTWNREGYVLANGTSIDAGLTLSVLPSFTNGTDFSFNIVITGMQQA